MAGLMGLVLYTDWFPVGTGNSKPGAPALAGAELPALASTAGPGRAALCHDVSRRSTHWQMSWSCAGLSTSSALAQGWGFNGKR